MLTMRVQLQRHGERLGCRNVSRAWGFKPTTPVRRPSCRRPDDRFVRDWLNRDPLGERGGRNLYGFVNNSPVNRFDALGLKCCVLFYSGSTLDGLPYDHTAIECDNGVYISAFPSNKQVVPASPAEWKDKEHDEKRWGKPKSTVCLDCVDEAAVSAWFEKAKGNTEFSGPCNNCSDIGREAINAGLPEQKKPTCPPCTIPEHRYRIVDIMEDPLLPSTASKLDRQAKALKENDCQRFKCELVFTPKRPFF